MSETKKSKQLPNNTANYIVFGKENELEKVTVKGKNTQDAVHMMPDIPMEIATYDNKVTNELGEPVSRIDENGKKFNVEAKYTSVGKKLEEKDKQEKGQDR